MQCPNDATTLAMTERQGVEIDYCPKCRGVWLDRGELDKIVEQSDQSSIDTPGKSDRMNNSRNRSNDEEDGGSFFGNLFDF